MSVPTTTARHHAKQSPSTSTQILDVAERLAQTRGFNGFSYADIAAELGITKASLHYHFPTKTDLGNALIQRYSTTYAHALSQITASGADARAQLRGYVDLYKALLVDDRICLCGMFAAEYATLPQSMQHAVREFFDENEAWLAPLLESGRRASTLAFDGAPEDAARVLTSTLEGAMLLARSYGEVARFTATADHVFRELTPVAPSPSSERRLNAKSSKRAAP